MHMLDCNKPLLTTKPNFINYLLVQTTKQNKEKCSPRQIEKADGARKLHTKVCRPGVQFFRDILDKYLIRNFPCTKEEDKVAFDMHGSEACAIRDRCLRKPQQVAPRLEIVEVEENVKSPHKEVRLFEDDFWFMVIPFAHAMFENIGFRITELIPNREST